MTAVPVERMLCDRLCSHVEPRPVRDALLEGLRAARFEVQGDTLAYNVVLSREHAGKNPFGGVMQLVVAGASGRANDLVTLGPVPVSVGLYDTVRGTLPLPQGFAPRQTTVNVLDKIGGKLMGMRVVNVS